MSEVLKATGEKGQNLRALFISVDPERDRPETLKSYLSSFDERITGLTGDETTVAAALKAYRAYARKVPTKDGDYTMEHTSYVYLMDRRNRFVGSQDLGRPPEDVARDLQKHL
jgi:protein SCO1/2